MDTNLNLEITRGMKRKSSPDDEHKDEHEDEHDMLTLSLSIQPPSTTNSRPPPPPPPLNFSPPQPPPAPPAVIYPQPRHAIQPTHQPSSFINLGVMSENYRPNLQVPSLAAVIYPPLQAIQPTYQPPSFINLGVIPENHRPNLQVPAPVPVMYRPAAAEAPRRRTRQRRSPTGNQNNGENDTITPPYPWATNKKAIIHTFTELQSMKITKISGEVKCKTCFETYEMEFDLEQKFLEVGSYVAENRDSMLDRAPRKWINPDLPTCKACGQENAMKPVISEDLEKINWLFLLLGEMLGLCKLEQLKYLCKHTGNHCTGAKDRLVYLVYLTLCDQLAPGGPFTKRLYS